MRQPIVAIIGRPNVGKSTLVNRIVGSRRAIVDDMPGVTRDRAYYEVNWLSHNFTLVDTGGLAIGIEDGFAEQVNEQVIIALEEADAIIFVVDGPAGIHPLDQEVIKLFRGMKKPIFMAVNKIDGREQFGYCSEFYGLGIGEPHALSALHGSVGVGDLLDKVIEAVLKDDNLTTDPIDHDTLRIAFVGRPNVGKSSIVNKLLGEERSIVSDVAGTTRDSIDTELLYQDQRYTLVDTAGIRRKSKVAYGVEGFSVDRALRALKRADVTALVIDAVEGLTDQDKRIIETSTESGKALMLIINKWDTVEKKDTNTTQRYLKKLYLEAPHIEYAPAIFVSAITGQRLDKIFEQAQFVHANNTRRITTSVVNQLILDAYHYQQPPITKNKQLKIYYATQVQASPPTFLLFVNQDTLMTESYMRFLENRIRAQVEFTGAPLRIFCRNKQTEEEGGRKRGKK
jgi:GTPase